MKNGLSPLQIAKFWSRVDVHTDFQCWPWKGRTNGKGYGRTDMGMAHRIAYELVNGSIPAGAVIRHRCDNPRCCNPSHLLPGSEADNARDAVERGRTSIGGRNGRTRLTEEDVSAIRANVESLSLKEMAARYGMAQSSIHYIRTGRSWKSVSVPLPIKPTN
jgi:hypothetical protein